MPQSNTMPQGVEPILAQALEVNGSAFWTKEITDLFPWSKTHRFFWATTRERRNAVVVSDGRGDNRLLTVREGWRALSPVLMAEKRALPGDLSAMEVAEAVRKLTVGPPGFVGSALLLQRKSPPLHAWLKGGPDADEATFRSFCLTPQIERHPQTDEWNLNFYYFNDRGGVEQWFLTGTNVALEVVTMKRVSPDGTFNWPFE